MRTIAERLADAEAWAAGNPDARAIARGSALQDWLNELEGSADVPTPEDVRAAVQLMAEVQPDRLADLLNARDEHPPRLVRVLRARPATDWAGVLSNAPRSVRLAVTGFLAQTSPQPLPD